MLSDFVVAVWTAVVDKVDVGPVMAEHSELVSADSVPYSGLLFVDLTVW